MASLEIFPPYLAFLLPPFISPYWYIQQKADFLTPAPKKICLFVKIRTKRPRFGMKCMKTEETRQCTGAATCCARIYNVLRLNSKALQVDFKRVANLLTGLAEAVRTIHY